MKLLDVYCFNIVLLLLYKMLHILISKKSITIWFWLPQSFIAYDFYFVLVLIEFFVCFLLFWCLLPSTIHNLLSRSVCWMKNKSVSLLDYSAVCVFLQLIACPSTFYPRFIYKVSKRENYWFFLCNPVNHLHNVNFFHL